jgi:hypothetical protein
MRAIIGSARHPLWNEDKACGTNHKSSHYWVSTRAAIPPVVVKLSFGRNCSDIINDSPVFPLGDSCRTILEPVERLGLLGSSWVCVGALGFEGEGMTSGTEAASAWSDGWFNVSRLSHHCEKASPAALLIEPRPYPNASMAILRNRLSSSSSKYTLISRNLVVP